jgi:hypothetical protein
MPVIKCMENIQRARNPSHDPALVPTVRQSDSAPRLLETVHRHQHLRLRARLSSLAILLKRAFPRTASPRLASPRLARQHQPNIIYAPSCVVERVKGGTGACETLYHRMLAQHHYLCLLLFRWDETRLPAHLLSSYSRGQLLVTTFITPRWCVPLPLCYMCMGCSSIVNRVTPKYSHLLSPRPAHYTLLHY